MARVWWALVCAGAMLGLGGCSNPQFGASESLLDVSQDSLDWGVVATGSEVPRALVLHNPGRVEVTINAARAPRPFEVVGLPPEGVVLAGGETRPLEVVFAPSEEGTYATELLLETSSGGPRSLTLTGQAVQAVATVNPDQLQFGQVLLGTSKTLGLALSNATPLAVEVGVRLDGADRKVFAAQSGPSLTLEPGSSTTITLAFSPSRLGAAEAQLFVRPCEGCGEMTVPLWGEGVASCIGVDRPSIRFGAVEIGQEGVERFSVTNLGGVPTTVTEVFLASSSSKEFAVEGFAPDQPVALPPGETLALTARFAPSSYGPKTGAVRIRAFDGAGTCWAEARLEAAGGTACLQVSPTALDFGAIASGMSARRGLLLANAACGQDVLVEALEVDGSPAFSPDSATPPPFLLKPNEVAQVGVVFAPDSPGSFSGSLRVLADDAQGRPLADAPAPVPLTGVAKALPACRYTATPPRVDFGAVDVGNTAYLGFRLTNVGQDACYFADLQLAPSSSPAFRLSGASRGFLLLPGRSHDARVRFTPNAAASYQGAIELDVSDPAAPHRSFPITGTGITGCLTVRPADLDFGTVFVGCPPPTRSSLLTNGCSGSVVLQSLTIGPGTSTEFSVPSAPSLPYTIPAGGNLVLDVRYAPVDKGADSAPIFLDDGTARHLIAARGVGVIDPTRTDSFDQQLQQKVDVLFVLDNSGSMSDKQAAVGANLASFLRTALAQNVDYHLAVTTTGLEPSTGGWTDCPGGAEGGEDGRLFPVDNSTVRVLTRSTPDAQAAWAALTNVGVCHWLEQGLEAANRALFPPLIDQADDPRTTRPDDGNLGFMRPDAKLAVVFVSDEEDQSLGPVDYYANRLLSLKPDPSLVTVSAIVSPPDLSACPSGTSSGLRYMEVARRTGGATESICTPDWAASLGRLGESAFGLRSVFPLSGLPGDPAKIQVSVNGVVVPAAGNWQYDAGTNAVVFDQDSVPGAGSHIDIRYEARCP